MQLCKYAIMQVCKYASMQVFKYAFFCITLLIRVQLVCQNNANREVTYKQFIWDLSFPLNSAIQSPDYIV